MFHICSTPPPDGEGRVSGSVEAVPPAAACDRSVGAQPTGARRTLRWKSRSSVSRAAALRPSGAAALEGLAAKRARREMAPQRLEKVQFAPENGMAPADLDPQYLVSGQTAISVPKHYRRFSPNIRGVERGARRACLGGAAASRAKLHDLAPKALKSLARQSTLRVWLDEMETRRRHVIASSEASWRLSLRSQ